MTLGTEPTQGTTLLTKPLFGLCKKQTNEICLGGSVSTNHDVFFTHLEAIENLIKIEFPGGFMAKHWLI